MTPTREIFRSLLISTLVHSRASLTADGMGGSTQTLTALGSVPGRLRPLNPREMESAARMETDFSHIAYVEAPLDVRPGDIFSFRGEQYRVIDIQEPSYMQFSLQIHLRREVT